jgi:hypothetical protein
MTDNIVMNKAEFCEYAQALLKNHNVSVETEDSDSIHFPEGSPPELLAHTVFKNNRSTVIIKKYETVAGAIMFSSKRSYTKDCKVASIDRFSPAIEHLLPNNLTIAPRSAS